MSRSCCHGVAWGILANALATGLAAVAYGAAAFAAQRRQARLGRGTGSAPALFDIIAVYLAIAALRQVAAWLSQKDPALVEADRILYLVVLVPAAVVIVPHVHLVSLVVWGRRPLARTLALAFLAVVAVGLAFAYAGGIDGPTTSAYGTDWSMRSVVTQVILVAAIMLPGLVGSAALVVLARRMQDADDRRRVRLIGWSCLVYFAVFTADAFGLAGIPLLAARLATAGTGLLAWLAYRPGGKDLVYEPPREDPKDALWGR
jgi:hypothetical protein